VQKYDHNKGENMHNFTVNGKNYSLNEMTVLAIFAIVNLPRANELAANRRVLAIKQLRSVTGLGNFEAKQIVDFVYERGRIRDNGEVYMDLPQPPAVTYSFGV
jgi:hypothetical protein